MRRIAALALLVPLAACSSPDPEPTPAPEDVDPAGLVSERYSDCLADLEATDPVTADDGTTVTATIEGAILTWNVGTANTDDVLTVPADEATIAALETVGC